MRISAVDHVAIICNDYETSKSFYVNVLGFTIVNEVFRKERHSWKCDLAINGKYQIELFSFPDPPQRLTHPEAAGLRHIALHVEDFDETMDFLKKKNIPVETVRVDQYKQKRFTFIHDPDMLPIELCEK